MSAAVASADRPARLLHVLFSGLGGHSAVVFGYLRAPSAARDEHRLVFYGIEEVPEGNRRWCDERGIPYAAIHKRPGLDSSAFARVAREIAAFDGCVLLHIPRLATIAAAAARLRHRRLVIIEHEPNHLKGRKQWIDSALSARVADHVVFLTDVYAHTVKQKLGPLFPRRWSVIGNSVDTRLFVPRPRPRDDRFVFGMHARFVPMKDQATIVRALARLDAMNLPLRAHAKLAGDGPTLASVRALASELGVADRVELPGLLSEQELPGWLQEMDVFVQSTFGETMSTSMMQAMACGLGVIGSDVGGVREMIRVGRDGILFPQGDDEQLADHLRRLILDRARLATLGRSARERAVSEYDCEIAYTRYRALASV